MGEMIKKQKDKLKAAKKKSKNADKIKIIQENIKKLREKRDYKAEMKNISLGTSKNNYIDPRITVAFMKKHNIPVDKEFFGDYYWGTNGYWKKSKLTINSALPLRIKTNDPYKKLLVQTDAIKDNLNYFYKAEITLHSPLINDVMNELTNSILAREKYTHISVTSLDSWKKLGNNLTVKYNAVLDQPLPKLFLDIIDIASKETNPVDQINIVTKMLNEKVEYFGDWRSINGKFIPQNFTKVATKQSGDCKDFSAITVKILRELGYKTNIALVHRGAGYQSKPDILPTMWDFNHAMVKAIDKTGKIIIPIFF